MAQLRFLMIFFGLIIISITLKPVVSFAQDSIKTGLKANIGFNTGVLFSQFINNPKYASNIINSKTESKFRTGFSAGIFVTLFSSKHFSCQPEINYYLIQHVIQYDGCHISHFSDYCIDAHYSMSASFLQFSLMPKIIFSKRVKTYIGFGPYFNIKIANKIKGYIDEEGTDVKWHYITDTTWYLSVSHYNKTTHDNDIKVGIKNITGLFACLGISVPCKENNFGIEIRAYWYPKDIISTLHIKQRFYTINFVYQFISKKHAW